MKDLLLTGAVLLMSAVVTVDGVLRIWREAGQRVKRRAAPRRRRREKADPPPPERRIGF